MTDDQPGVTVFHNGPVFLADPARSMARAVVVQNGMIVAVGSYSTIERYLPQAERVIDLKGRLLLPGFIDAHAHPIRGGLERLQCNLIGGADLNGYQRILREYATSHPGKPWITGGGWAPEAMGGLMPTSEALDVAVWDRPVCLADQGHHSFWVNSRALQIAGVDARTPDPPDGRIERDPTGRPTGVLHEGASKLVERLIPGERAEDYDNALQEAQRYLHSHGIVGWQDAMVLRPGPGAASYEAYRRGQRDGWLTARVVAALWWDRHITSAGVTDAVASLVEARDAAADGTRYTAGTVKIMLDGVVETQTASVLQPYTDGCGCPTENAGLSFIEPDLLNEIVTQLDRAGFQVHFHALGDRAVRDALDAVEIAQAANRTGDRRHHIAHLQLISPDDMPRFRRLGVAANIQGLWATRDPETDAITFPALGSTRGEQQFPFGPLLNDGATLVMGSDWPVSSPEPMAAVHALVNRVAYDAPRGTQPLGEVHRLPLTTALAAYTAGSAWINGDAQGGSIVVGNRADLVVLDRDPFELPAEEIGGIKVVQTYVSGALVAEN